jgi:hypothetical protein
MNTKESWLDENCHWPERAVNDFPSLRPDIGFYMNVNGLDIGQILFPEEYLLIQDAYFSVLKKLKDHTKKVK